MGWYNDIDVIVLDKVLISSKKMYQISAYNYIKCIGITCVLHFTLLWISYSINCLAKVIANMGCRVAQYGYM